MIVMKFGGSSVASAANIRQVASIVQSQLDRNPVVVVSALGKTTDRLLDLLANASQRNTHAVSKLQEELKEYHFTVAEELLQKQELREMDAYLRAVFRDLHIQMLEVCEENAPVTPALRDQVLSLGEQISSRIVAAGLRSCQINTVHQDARKIILTDRHFTQATPQQWETLARVRWTIPQMAKSSVVVIGGFMGATEQGETTTLGRGGSDLTATLIGAGVNAEEIQIWKDVDGMMTCDPKLKVGYCLKRISYQEAEELAQAGAKILHPDTVAPARRLRIPIVLKNTFRPELGGTRIASDSGGSSTPVKSIACKLGMTVLEIRSPFAQASLADCAEALCEMCRQQSVQTKLLGVSESVIYLAIDSKADYHHLRFPLERCLEIRIHTQQAQLTLVGDSLMKECDLKPQIQKLLENVPVTFLPRRPDACALPLLIPAKHLFSCLEALHSFSFSNPDPALFVPLLALQPQRGRKEKSLAPPVQQTNQNLWWAKRKLASLGMNKVSST